MWITAIVPAALALASLASAAAAAERKPGLHRMVAEKLLERKASRETRDAGVPQTHVTDFGSDAIGCLTLPRWEMRSFGYPGHAFACEEAAGGEVMGAVLDRRGRTLCFIEGAYTGDDCYDLSICDESETLCVR